MKKRIAIAVALLVVAIALFVVFSRGNSKKYEFRFDKVTQGDITMYVTATGTINAVTSVEVGTQVSGIISKLYADFNSIVKEGAVHRADRSDLSPAGGKGCLGEPRTGAGPVRRCETGPRADEVSLRKEPRVAGEL